MKESIRSTRQEKQKEIWKSFSRLHKTNPALVAGLLGIQFLVVLVTYFRRLDLGQALGVAVIFQVIWVVVFFLLPALWEILKALEEANWVKTKAAKLLKMNRTTLIEKMKKKKLRKPATDS